MLHSSVQPFGWWFQPCSHFTCKYSSPSNWGDDTIWQNLTIILLTSGVDSTNPSSHLNVAWYHDHWLSIQSPSLKNTCFLLCYVMSYKKSQNFHRNIIYKWLMLAFAFSKMVGSSLATMLRYAEVRAARPRRAPHRLGGTVWFTSAQLKPETSGFLRMRQDEKGLIKHVAKTIEYNQFFHPTFGSCGLMAILDFGDHLGTNDPSCPSFSLNNTQSLDMGTAHGIKSTIYLEFQQIQQANQKVWLKTVHRYDVATPGRIPWV